MKWKKENNIHSKQQHKYSTFFLFHFCFTHTYISLSIISLHQTPHLPHWGHSFFFSTCFLCALKGSWGGGGGGGGFFLHRNTFHDITEKNWGEEERDKSFSSTQLEIHKMLYKKETVYEKVFFCFRHLILWKKSGVYIWPIYIVYVSK